MLHMLTVDFCWEKLKFEKKKNLHNSGDYLKNHWTNTRLVCTHFNAFFMLNPNMVIKIKFKIIFENVVNFGLSSALNIHVVNNACNEV